MHIIGSIAADELSR